MNFRRPEEELVFLFAQTKASDKVKARLEVLLQQPIDWNFCIDFARYHHVTPLFFNSLFNLCPTAPPADFMKQTKQWYQQHSLRNLLVTAELLKVQRGLQNIDIPMLVVKGPALAKLVYGDVRLREFGDLDIVVHVADVSRVKDLLLEMGYELTDDVTLDAETTYVRSHYNYPFVHKTRLFNIEVHWRLWQSEFGSWMKLDDVWKNVKPVAFNARESVFTLMGSDLLLYLCAHGSKHQWSRMSWICDINELLTSDINLDWELVALQSKQVRSVRMVLLGLYLAHTIFDTPLPEPINELVRRDGEIEVLANDMVERLLERKQQDGDLRYYLRIRENWIDKALHVTRLVSRRMIPTDRDTKWIKLPPQLFFLYYLARPIRLIARLISGSNKHNAPR